MLNKNIHFDDLSFDNLSTFRQGLIDRLNHKYSVQIANDLYNIARKDPEKMLRIVNMLISFLDDEIYNTKIIHVFLYLLQRIVLDDSDQRQAKSLVTHFLNYIYSHYDLHSAEQHELLSDLEFNADFLWYQQIPYIWLMFARVSEERYIHWATMSSDERNLERSRMYSDDYYIQIFE